MDHHIFKEKRAVLENINCKLNPADLYTKYLSRAEIVFHMAFLGHRLFDEMGHEVGNKDSEKEWSEADASDIEMEKEDEGADGGSRLAEVLAFFSTAVGQAAVEDTADTAMG